MNIMWMPLHGLSHRPRTRLERAAETSDPRVSATSEVATSGLRPSTCLTFVHRAPSCHCDR